MTRQRWGCPKCSYTYDSPISISEILCPRQHPNTKTRVAMQLLADADSKN